MAFGATVEQIKFVSTWLYCTNPELKARDEESEGWSEHRFARLYEMNDDTSGQTDRERIDQLNEILEELGEDFRFELASEPKMDKAVHEWYGTHPGSTSTPPASSNTAPLISALTECVACLERYCGPGTRGHEARKKARELLKGLGVDLES